MNCAGFDLSFRVRFIPRTRNDKSMAGAKRQAEHSQLYYALIPAWSIPGTMAHPISSPRYGRSVGLREQRAIPEESVSSAILESTRIWGARIRLAVESAPGI